MYAHYLAFFFPFSIHQARRVLAAIMSSRTRVNGVLSYRHDIVTAILYHHYIILTAMSWQCIENWVVLFEAFVGYMIIINWNKTRFISSFLVINTKMFHGTNSRVRLYISLLNNDRKVYLMSDKKQNSGNRNFPWYTDADTNGSLFPGVYPSSDNELARAVKCLAIVLGRIHDWRMVNWCQSLRLSIH